MSYSTAIKSNKYKDQIGSVEQKSLQSRRTYGEINLGSDEFNELDYTAFTFFLNFKLFHNEYSSFLIGPLETNRTTKAFSLFPVSMCLLKFFRFYNLVRPICETVA